MNEKRVIKTRHKEQRNGDSSSGNDSDGRAAELQE